MRVLKPIKCPAMAFPIKLPFCGIPYLCIAGNTLESWRWRLVTAFSGQSAFTTRKSPGKNIGSCYTCLPSNQWCQGTAYQSPAVGQLVLDSGSCLKLHFLPRDDPERFGKRFVMDKMIALCELRMMAVLSFPVLELTLTCCGNFKGELQLQAQIQQCKAAWPTFYFGGSYLPAITTWSAHSMVLQQPKGKVRSDN